MNRSASIPVVSRRGRAMSYLAFLLVASRRARAMSYLASLLVASRRARAMSYLASLLVASRRARAMRSCASMKILASISLAITSVGAAACSSPTGSTCPTDNPPTYASFGEQFFADYCTGCHSANATNRHDAPGDQNFDTEADIKRHADDIDSEAAAGPDATNTDMPDLSGPVHQPPSVEERKLLGQYLACLKSQ